jgi:hypothetical protein
MKRSIFNSFASLAISMGDAPQQREELREVLPTSPFRHGKPPVNLELQNQSPAQPNVM